MSGAAQVDEVVVDPARAGWRSVVDRWIARRDDGEAARFRRECGLPADAPVVMTGHQPAPWHCGIAAKFFASEAIAEAVGGESAAIVPDQDAVQPYRVRFPAVRDRRLVDESVALSGDLGAGVPAGAADAADPSGALPGDRAALESVRQGIERYRDALRARGDAPTSAAQATGAMLDLLGEPFRSWPVVFATRLQETTLFGELLERLREDPRAAVEAYNDALRSAPGGGTSALRVDGDRVELPLWEIERGRPRRRVFSDRLDEVDRDRLAPRALLMTALARLAGCDVFIHGTGGAAYDRATERWIDAWLGRPLAPVVTATATARLPLEDMAASDEAIDRAAWRAHAARHNPSMLGDSDAAARKAELLERIERARSNGEDPGEAFREMHEALDGYRRAHADELDELDEAATRLSALRGSDAVARDRAWPCFLFDEGALGALRSRVREAVGVEAPAARA